MATPTPSSDGMIIGTNSRPSNPTPLSAPQEQQVRDLYYKNARSKCAQEIETFAACALGRTITMVWACRAQKLTMNACMLQFQTQDEMDKARAQWFQLAGERRKAREDHQQRLEDARHKHKEWWNLDEEGRTQGKILEAGARREENKVDDRGVRRGGVWGGT
ncbi:hypothetical protein P153DRAFT_342783 [Dothidotthia symphoricarpi CBS 119687]|uniref:COX assembly mitochondrial protein n=1 Tax=Dothidotthia symphoricarpi CBS 119687 TaxID=1392245 RepID=A0A6A6AAI8_9PLEO|nr:uncharacterized protein P153DRAFT_342783 [Dothidotthia symphoricarpi CBS 119687]KAF2127867.1 hypothetical protein P153DRAFT_342783 [Dothidotthia symphoricarpi CBS 119687]